MLVRWIPAVASHADSVENTSRIGRPQPNPSASISSRRGSPARSAGRSFGRWPLAAMDGPSFGAVPRRIARNDGGIGPRKTTETIATQARRSPKECGLHGRRSVNGLVITR